MRLYKIQNYFKIRKKYLIGEIDIIKLIFSEKLLNGEKLTDFEIEILDVYDDLYRTTELLEGTVFNKEFNYFQFLFKTGINEDDLGKLFRIELQFKTSLKRILKLNIEFETMFQ